MSFLCILNRTATQPNANPKVDCATLSTRLCPYQGELQHLPLPQGDLFLSSLAGVHGSGALIPHNSHQNPQSAWLRISLENGNLGFETDPLGMFPLWCYEDDTHLIITSEVKSLAALQNPPQVILKPDADLLGNQKRPADFSPYVNVRRLRPGALVQVTPDLRVEEQGCPPLEYHPTSLWRDIEESKTMLAAALLASADRIAANDGQWGAFLSGGIDSSTATALLNQLRPTLHTFTLGTEFGDEYADAQDLANHLQLTHTPVFARQDEALSHFERAIFCNETIDGLTAETLAQLSVLTHAARHNVTHIVTGYGADLLFGSMLRHALYMQVTGVDDLQSLIERTRWSGEFSPFFAWSQGIQVHHLFWDPPLMNCAFRIPDELNVDGHQEKIPLRTLAVENGFMQAPHAFRKKHALTDGTQFNRVLSNALALDDKHAYRQKGAFCIALLRKALAG